MKKPILTALAAILFFSGCTAIQGQPKDDAGTLTVVVTRDDRGRFFSTDASIYIDGNFVGCSSPPKSNVFFKLSRGEHSIKAVYNGISDERKIYIIGNGSEQAIRLDVNQKEPPQPPHGA